LFIVRALTPALPPSPSSALLVMAPAVISSTSAFSCAPPLLRPRRRWSVSFVASLASILLIVTAVDIFLPSVGGGAIIPAVDAAFLGLAFRGIGAIAKIAGKAGKAGSKAKKAKGKAKTSKKLAKKANKKATKYQEKAAKDPYNQEYAMKAQHTRTRLPVLMTRFNRTKMISSTTRRCRACTSSR